MATAYATIASGGYRNRPTAITKVEFERTGRSELPRRFRPHRTKVFPDGVTYEATKILEDNIRGGTGTRANIGCPAGGKTGTTDRNTDAWFVGFTPRLSTAVWVGYPDARVEMNGLFYGGPVDGGTFPAAIWGAYMKQAKGRFCGDFRQPKEPFQPQPFSGRYAGGGGNVSGGDGTTAPSTGFTPTTPAPSAPAPSTGGTEQPDAGNQGNGGTGFDPETYESPPQGPPATARQRCRAGTARTGPTGINPRVRAVGSGHSKHAGWQCRQHHLTHRESHWEVLREWQPALSSGSATRRASGSSRRTTAGRTRSSTSPASRATGSARSRRAPRWSTRWARARRGRRPPTSASS